MEDILRLEASKYQSLSQCEAYVVHEEVKALKAKIKQLEKEKASLIENYFEVERVC